MKFDWSEFTREEYETCKRDYEDGKYIADRFLGCIHVGEICIDVIVRDYGTNDGPEFAYSFDFYVGNEDTGYGYKDMENGGVVAYDYADGDDIYVFSYDYDEFVKESESLIESYINKNDDKYSYSLVEKANKPLFMF